MRENHYFSVNEKKSFFRIYSDLGFTFIRRRRIIVYLTNLLHKLIMIHYKYNINQLYYNNYIVLVPNVKINKRNHPHTYIVADVIIQRLITFHIKIYR